MRFVFLVVKSSQEHKATQLNELRLRPSTLDNMSVASSQWNAIPRDVAHLLTHLGYNGTLPPPETSEMSGVLTDRQSVKVAAAVGFEDANHCAIRSH